MSENLPGSSDQLEVVIRKLVFKANPLDGEIMTTPFVGGALMTTSTALEAKELRDVYCACSWKM